MTINFDDTVRNARSNAIETAVGTSPVVKIRTGAKPATCATADSGTVLATMNLPADWMSDAVAGAKTILGLWQDAAADAGGSAGHFRLYSSDGTTCRIQGSVTATGGGGDMTLDNILLALGQQVNVVTFTLAEGNG